MAKHRGFNMIGFKDKSIEGHFLKCPIHVGIHLVPDPKDKSVYICPSCGMPYQEKELTHDTGPQSKFGKPGAGLLLLQPDAKKKLRAEDGTEIPEDDDVAKMDLAQGRKIVSYHEYKVEK